MKLVKLVLSARVCCQPDPKARYGTPWELPKKSSKLICRAQHPQGGPQIYRNSHMNMGNDYLQHLNPVHAPEDQDQAHRSGAPRNLTSQPQGSKYVYNYAYIYIHICVYIYMYMCRHVIDTYTYVQTHVYIKANANFTRPKALRAPPPGRGCLPRARGRALGSSDAIPIRATVDILARPQDMDPI